MFGLSLAVILFEKDYQLPAAQVSDEVTVMKMYLPSLPYSGDLEITQDPRGLIRHQGKFYNPTHLLHQNDTLYVTLQANEVARDHFFELANAMQTLTNREDAAPSSPYGKAVELLSNLLKVYLPSEQKLPVALAITTQQMRAVHSHFLTVHYRSFETALTSPPPERC